MKPIGATFSDELRAAGLLGLPFSWGADGSFHFDDAMTDEQRAAVMEVYASHDPDRADAARAIAANIAAVQGELDRQAQLRGYDNIVSACSYAPGPADDPFAVEGRAFLAWRSTVWQTAYALLDEVKRGTRAMPTPAEAISAMPPLSLPVAA